MNLNIQEITFIIVTYKANKIIHNCINSLPKSSKIIIVETSNDLNMKKDLEKKYDNIEVILSKNNGMGYSNNIGLRKVKTKFAFILNPDVLFKEDTFIKLQEEIKNIDDFAIISPIHEDNNFPNYKFSKKIKFNENILDVEEVDGYSMLLNLEKFKNNDFFDENFFLYLENVDLCRKQKKNNQKIFIIKNSEIRHFGSYTSKLDQSNKIEYLRNWHWMWSKFYFNKKHKGYLFAFAITMPNFFSSIIKYFFYLCTLNNHKKIIFKMRFLGLLNSILCNKSFLRPDN